MARAKRRANRTLIFWLSRQLELPALAAVAHGLNAAILYRWPSIASADRIIQDMRAVKMGRLIPAGRDALLKLAEALKNGQHVGMMVDQYLTKRVELLSLVARP